jgi:predicted anti-sigma-YlaC factor YlaD
MKHRAVREKYPAWSEGRLAAGESLGVRDHLDGCDECRAYYEKMSLLLESTDPALLPRLAPDPFLPARIRALAAERRTEPVRRRALGWLRFSAAGLMILFAAMAGVYLGLGISTSGRAADTAEGTDIAGAYYEVFAPSDFSGVWESVLGDANGSGALTGEEKR